MSIFLFRGVACFQFTCKETYTLGYKSLNKVRKLTIGFVVNDFFLFLLSELLKEDFVVPHEFDRSLCERGGGLFEPELGRKHNFACKF